MKRVLILSTMLAFSAAAAAQEIDHNAMPDPNDVDVVVVPGGVPHSPAVRAARIAKAKAPAKDIPLIDTMSDASNAPDVSFVTGGVGDDEKAAIEESKADYNLHLTNASPDGAFVGDVHVIIAKKTGNEMEPALNVIAGPLLYVKLPQGTYVLEATLGEQSKRQDIKVTAKTTSITKSLIWQQ